MTSIERVLPNRCLSTLAKDWRAEMGDSVYTPLSWQTIASAKKKLRYLSNRKAVESALAVAARPSSQAQPWMLIFEDDIAINPNITAAEAQQAIAQALRMAEGEAFLYLGLCNAECGDFTSCFLPGSAPGQEPVRASGAQCGRDLTFRRCHGLCTHAMAVSTAHAASFARASYVEHKRQVPPSRSFASDQILFSYGASLNGFLVAGANLVVLPTKGSPETQYGVFYQDRSRFKSSITGPLWAAP